MNEDMLNLSYYKLKFSVYICMSLLNYLSTTIISKFTTEILDILFSSRKIWSNKVSYCSGLFLYGFSRGGEYHLLDFRSYIHCTLVLNKKDKYRSKIIVKICRITMLTFNIVCVPCCC